MVSAVTSAWELRSPDIPTSGSGAGSVHIFQKSSTSTHTYQSRDNFGIARQKHPGNCCEDDKFCVCFRGDANNNFSQVLKLRGDDTNGTDSFGRAVALDNDLLMISADQKVPHGSMYGRIYVFRQQSESPLSYVQESDVDPFDKTTGMHFGSTISSSHRILVVGAETDVVDSRD